VYTEKEIRKEIKMKINGLDPALWRRVVTRRVTGWEPEA